MKKITKTVATCVLAFSMLFPAGAFADDSKNNQSNMVSIANKKIEERIQLGFKEFEDVAPGKIIDLKDENDQVTKSLIVLNRSDRVAGYFVIDHATGLIVEFATGDTYPGQGQDTANLYYLGALFYVNKIDDNKYLDVKTNLTFDNQTFKSLIDERQKIVQQDELIVRPIPSEQSIDVGTFTIINYEYDLISGVPDYQQNDNSSMDNDCVPTTGAAIAMYWDSNGYPNMSSSNNWLNVADRLGELMDHDDSYGVYSSDVKSGFDSYISEKGYSSNFSVTRDTSVSFSDIKSEVGADSPAFLRLIGYSYNDPTGADGGHMVTLVGYESYTDTSDWSNPKYALVQDNWESTGKTVYLLMGSFGTMTDLWKVRD